MERHNATRLLIVAIGIAGILTAQTRIDLSSQSRRIDFSNAPAVKPLPVGSVLPATCNVGEMFFKTDAANGQNVYMCPAHDVWVQSAIPMSLQTGSSGGILLTGSAETLDVDADTMFLATQAGNNLFIGHNDFSGAASLRITTGSLEPAAAGCDSSSETGSIYMLTGDSTKANLLYICQANAGGFGWHAGTYAQGANAPSTCVVGQVFFDTDAPAGENWLGCTTANTWTVMGRTHGKGPTAPPSCSVGDVFFDTDAAAGENWLGCTTTNTWTAIGKPHGKGPTPPASCSVGDVFFDTDAAAGENWLGCTATNSWTVIGKPHGKGLAPPVTCTVGDVFFDTDAPAGENWLGCTTTNTWTVIGKTQPSPSRLLTWQKQAPPTVLTGSETAFASTLVPGGTIPNGACLKFRGAFQHTTGTASVEYRIRYGNAYLMAIAPTTNTQIVRLEGFMCNDPGGTSSQQIALGYMLSTSNSSEQMTTMAVDSTVEQTLSLAAVGPATDAITLRYFLVEVLK